MAARNLLAVRCRLAYSAHLTNARNYGATGAQNVVESCVPTMEFERGNFMEYLMKDVNQRKNSMAVTCSVSGRNTSYGALRDNMARWGGYLQSRGLGRGAVVAVMAPNFADYPTVLFGTIGAGGVYTGVNPAYTPGEVAHHLEDSGAQLVVVHGLLEPVVRKALEAMKKDIPLLSIGPENPGQLPRVEDILASTSIGLASPAPVTGTETMCLLYSSGTTGKPKAVAISHNAGIANLAMLSHPKFFSAPSNTADDQKSYLNLLPMFHLSGLLITAGLSLFKGLRLHTMTKFDPKTFLDTISRSKISHLHLVPSLLNFVLSQPQFNRDNFGCVEGVLAGAAPVPPSAAAALVDRFGDHVRLQHLYGMTESLVTHMDPLGDTRLGFTGRLLPCVQAKVLHLDTGLPLPAHQDGEICLNGPCIMKHYHNNEAATKATVDSDGWLHTGDVGHYNEDGYFKVIDRTKEMIKVNGMQVAPSELEDIVLRLKGVVEVSVVGVPHDMMGEAPRAYIVTKEPVSSQQVMEIVGSNVAKYKQLAGGIVFVDELPKNATGKVMRKELVKMAAEGK